jgi:hypothetical protein
VSVTPEKLYNSIAQVIDEGTRDILYSQFISEYYPDAFHAIIKLLNKGEVHKSILELENKQ